MERSRSDKLAIFGLAFFCFGYFASYVPYSLLTKMVTSGLLEGMDGKGFSGYIIQPVTVFGNLVAVFTTLTLLGWWKYAKQWNFMGKSLPRPRWYTCISGLCTSSQIITTTLAYTFSGISIVFAMLLMKGGVLIMAPIVDLIVKRRKRKIYWPSIVASLLSLVAVSVAFFYKPSYEMTLIAVIDISLYLFGYFFRLFIMSNFAKSDDTEEMKGYLAEEQLVANTVLILSIFLIGFFGRAGDSASMGAQFWLGFVEYPFKGYFWITFLIGVFSYGTGIFGTLIFLDKRENTFTVPANRASSILAGIIASYSLYYFWGQKQPPSGELIGAGLIIVAIFFLMYRAIMDKRKRKQMENAKVKI